MHKKNKIIEKLKSKGVKVTPQRIAVIDYLESTDTHPSAEEIFENVTKEHPSISLATIYNTLEKLEEINEVRKVKISDDNKVNYDSIMESHHHFYCRKCKKIFDINVECDFSKTASYMGHIVEESHGYFKGLCSECKNK